MTDLRILVPSRGRPENVDRLVRACALTCQADTRLHFAFDDDDPCLKLNIKAAARHSYMVGPRDGLTGWTNALARRHPDATALASLGDDHLPVTAGWDALLLEALPAGGGWSYPNDLLRDDLPEAVVISAPIVKALGWFALPALSHWYIDNVWRDLGAALGRLVYCDRVIVSHENPRRTGQPGDATHSDAARGFTADMAAYQRWKLRKDGMAADLDTIRAAL
jgi:hypothetical protein